MKGLLLVWWREILERRLLLALAVIGLGGWAVQPVVMEPVVAGAFIILMTTLLVFLTALVSGGSVIARDLAAGRMSFFFTRPLGWWQIYGGKMLAAISLPAVVLMFGLMPLLGPTRWPESEAGRLMGLFFLGGPWAIPLWVVFIVGLGHGASLVFRSRSPWAAIDVLAAVAVAGVVVWARDGLHHYLSVGGGRAALHVLLLPVAALMLATAIQIAAGRSDLERGRFAFSWTLWPALALWATGLFIAKESLPFAAPRPLRKAEWVIPAPTGAWVALSEVRGKDAAWYLLHTGTGRRWLVPAEFSTFGRKVFAGGGHHLALPWARRIGKVPCCEMVLVDAERPSAWRIELPTEPIALSSDGTRLFAADARGAAVYEATSGRQLIAVGNEPAGVVGQATFLSESRVRAFRAQVDGIRILELDLVTGRTDLTGRIDSAIGAWHARHGRRFWQEALLPPIRLSPAGDTLLFPEILDSSGAQMRLALRDGRTGALRSVLVPDAVEAEGVAGFRADFLHDGRVVVLDRARRLLRLYSPRGQLLWTLDDVGCIAGQPSSSRLFLCRAGGTILIDTADARVLLKEPDLMPLGVVRNDSEDPAARISMGAEGTRLFLKDQQLIRLDAETGRRRTIVPQE